MPLPPCAPEGTTQRAAGGPLGQLHLPSNSCGLGSRAGALLEVALGHRGAPRRLPALTRAAISCAAALALLAGCQKEQSRSEALRVLCELPRRPAVKAEIDALPERERAPRFAALLERAVTHPEVRALVADPPKLEAALREAGLTDCWVFEAR